MNTETVAFQSSDKLMELAGTWAELFCKNTPDKKQLFIDHYVQRSIVRRFWSTSGDINGKRIAVCRLGDSIMLVFYQGQIRKINIKGNKALRLTIPSETKGPTKQIARFLDGLQRKFDAGCPPEGHMLDALTSFSGQANKEVVDVLMADIPKAMRIYPGPKKNRYAGFYSVSYKKYIGRYGNALKHFLSEIDQEILFLTRSLRCPSIALYNWLSNGNTERRMQAVRAYPVMLPIEILVGKGGNNGQLSHLTSLIDQGESIAALLAETYAISASVVKKLGKLSPYVVGSAVTYLKYEFNRNEFLKAVKAFKLGSKRPQTRKGWKTCIETMVSTDIDFSESNLSGIPPWESKEWSRLGAEIRNLYDLGSCRYILANRSIKKALAFSAEWHEKRNQVQKALLDAEDFKSCSWPGMLKEGVIHPETGLKFVEILDDMSLAHEGERMGHCVGGYSRVCFDGVSRIVSIRDGDRPLATIEYRIVVSKTGRKSFSCAQAHGPGNRPFTGPPATAFKWFTKNFRSFVNTYDLPPVPMHLRPIGRYDLSKKVKSEMEVWIEYRLGQLGYGEELRALKEERQHDYYDRYDD